MMEPCRKGLVYLFPFLLCGTAMHTTTPSQTSASLTSDISTLLISSETTSSTHTSREAFPIITDVMTSSTRTSSPATVTQSQTVSSTSLASAANNPSSTFTPTITQLSPTPAISLTPNLSSTLPEPTSEGPSSTPAVSERTGSLSVSTDTPSPSVPRESTLTTSLETTPTSQTNTAETTPTTELIQATPTTTPGTTSTGSDEGVFEKITDFFTSLPDEPAVLIGVILGPVAVILTIVVICVGCCCLRSSMKKNSARFDLAGSTTGASRNGGIGATYRPRSRASVQEMRHYDPDAFYGEFAYQTASQPYHTTMAATSPDAFLDPLPSISPLSYPSQLRHYLTSPEKRDHPSSPTPRISLTQSPNRIRKYPGGSPSLTRPTPLGEQLQRQAERNSMQGSRNSIQGSRASISAMGSRTSFSGSRNSFLSSNNTMSRDEMRSSGFMASGKTMSEEETSSLTSNRPLMRQASLDMVPTRESPVQLPPPRKRREYKSLTCITNPLAVEESEAREEGDGVDENDLRKDPLVPVMTSTPVNQGAEDLPTKEAKQRHNKAEVSWKVTESGSSSTLTTPRKKSLRQLTSLPLPEAEEREGDENDQEVSTALSKRAEGGGDNEKPEKDEKAPAKPMSRLEKLTSLTYNIRSSIRRSLKKKRVSFLTRTPESTPKAKKKTPPRTLPTAEPDFDPDPLMFSNPEAFDTEGPMLSPRIHTPSPLSPEFEGVDDYPQRYFDDLHNPDVYPETHALRHPYPGVGGGGRMRTYSDVPMFAPQLSQPTYYPSTMHYPQPSYPQLSQQYIPTSYGPPQPPVGSPSHRGFGPLSFQPTFQQPLVGSPPHHNLGPLSLPPQPLVGSPPHHAGGPLFIFPQPLVGSPPHHGGGPLSHPPHSMVGSPSHRGLGPLSVQPSLHQGFPPEPYSRRYTDSGVSSRSSRGRNERSSGDSRRQNRARSPDALTDTASNVSSRYDRGVSPDRFTETSTASELPSPDVNGGFTHGRDGYMDPPIHYRGIPTSPEDQQHLYPHQFYQVQGGSHPYGTGEKSLRGHSSGHAERSVDGPQMGVGNYRQSGLDSQQVQSPAHQPHSHHRRASVDRQQGQSRYGSNDTPKHSRHGSTDTPSHSRHGSTSDTPSHSRQGSSDTTNRSRRNSSDMTGQTRRGSTDATPSHSRQGSHDAVGGRDRRGSIENPPPPLASHIRRSTIDNQPNKTRRGSADSHTNGQRHGSVNSGRRSSVEGHPRPRTLPGFQPILEPRPQRNGPRGEGAWQHSQIDEAEEALQYGIGSQRGRMGWDEDNDATPTEHGIMQRAVETSTSSVKTKVSWNNEIIEHLRTPSDSSDRYDL